MDPLSGFTRILALVTTLCRTTLLRPPLHLPHSLNNSIPCLLVPIPLSSPLGGLCARDLCVLLAVNETKYAPVYNKALELHVPFKQEKQNSSGETSKSEWFNVMIHFSVICDALGNIPDTPGRSMSKSARSGTTIMPRQLQESTNLNTLARDGQGHGIRQSPGSCPSSPSQ